MDGQFSGKISTDDSEPEIKLTHHIVVENSTDPRVEILKEYLSKSPNASIKDIKKALIGFTKASDIELKDIIKAANIETHNKLYPDIQQITSVPVKRKHAIHGFSRDELRFLETYRNSPLKRKAIFAIYQREFPNSPRRITFLSDYYFHTKSMSNTQHIVDLPNIPSTHTNQHILTQTIKSLYKAGFTARTLPKVKPVISELLAQNSNYDEIELAIEFLKS